ncbi:MAG: imidazolonepropionase [Halioglobus sp.]
MKSLLTRKVLIAGLLSCFCANALADSLVIRDVKVHTMTSAGSLEGTDVLIDEGIVRAIGKNLSMSADREIDGKGKVLTPGVTSGLTKMGLVEISGIGQTSDASADNENFTAALEVVDSFNPHSTLIPHNRMHGVTRAVVAPAAKGSLFSGSVALVNLSGSVTESIEQRNLGVLVQFNEFAQSNSGGSRSAALASIRRSLKDATDYHQEKALYQRGEGRELSMSLDDLDALVPVVLGEQFLFANVSRSTDILNMLALAEQFNLKLIIVGAEEGWMVAEEIAQANVPVIIDPSNNLPVRFETLGARLDNAALLHAAGVTLMFTGMGWQNTHNAHLVTQVAGIAVSYGLPHEAALAALFLNPGIVFNLDGEGQVAEGRKADLVLWSNDPLELMREAELVMVNGEELPLVSRSTRLRDRYFAKLKADRDR